MAIKVYILKQKKMIVFNILTHFLFYIPEILLFRGGKTYFYSFFKTQMRKLTESISI